MRPAPEELEDSGQAVTIDEPREINLGTNNNPCPTFITALLSEDKIEEIKTFIYEFRDYFSWTYVEMTDISPEMSVQMEVK